MKSRVATKTCRAIPALSDLRLSSRQRPAEILSRGHEANAQQAQARRRRRSDATPPACRTGLQPLRARRRTLGADVVACEQAVGNAQFRHRPAYVTTRRGNQPSAGRGALVPLQARRLSLATASGCGSRDCRAGADILGCARSATGFSRAYRVHAFWRFCRLDGSAGARFIAGELGGCGRLVGHLLGADWASAKLACSERGSSRRRGRSRAFRDHGGLVVRCEWFSRQAALGGCR